MSRLAKYSEEVRSVRKITREILVPVLQEKPRNMMQIWKIIKKDNPELCDDEIKCTCGKKEGTAPEWKHQVRWGVQDLKYNKKIE